MVIGGECKHPVGEIHKKEAKMVGFVSCRVLSCIIRNILFLLFKSSHLWLIFKKGIHVGYPMRRFLRYCDVAHSVRLVTFFTHCQPFAV